MDTPKGAGASYSEQLIEAARRNNLDLLKEVLQEAVQGVDGEDAQRDAIADLINHTEDALGNTILHVAAYQGSYEVLDHILDQEGVEVDPINRLDKETPLHLVVKYSQHEPEHGTYLAEMLIEAGADPRIKNKNGQKPIALVAPGNVELKNILESSEYAHLVQAHSGKEEDEKEDEEDLDGPSDED